MSSQVVKCVADGEGEAEEVLNRGTIFDLKNKCNSLLNNQSKLWITETRQNVHPGYSTRGSDSKRPNAIILENAEDDDLLELL